MNRTTYAKTAPEALHEQPSDQTASGCLLRLYWLFLGNILMFLLAYGIAARGVAVTTFDIVYWLGAASLLTVRLVDIQFLHGATAEGAPATIGHWRRYSLIVLAVAVVVWLAAHGIGIFVG